VPSQAKRKVKTVANSIQDALYLSFKREQWAELRKSVPLTLSEAELTQLKGMNEKLSLDEVTDIYLPLSRLLNLIVGAKQQRGLVIDKFLSQQAPKSPYIISIAGSVAVGKAPQPVFYKRFCNAGRNTQKST
jgi:type I pantothenate kinase